MNLPDRSGKVPSIDQIFLLRTKTHMESSLAEFEMPQNVNHPKNKSDNNQVSRLKQAPNPFVLMEARRRIFKPGEKILRDIRAYQESPDFMMPKLPFRRLVRGVTDGVEEELRWTQNAMLAIQTASQEYMTGLFGDVDLCAQHAHRKTANSKDVTLTRRLRGPTDPGYQ